MSKRRNKQLRYTAPQYRHLQVRETAAPQVNVLQSILHILGQRERENRLPWLTLQRANELWERYREGYLADVQLTWDQLEMRDEDLFAGVLARQSALADLPWRVVTDADAVGEDAAKQALAARQQELLTQRLNAVENLDAALVHLGMADFRGVAALEITGNSHHQRWEVIEPWLLARPSATGPWLYNEDAAPMPSMLEELDEGRVIITEAPPIDMPVMFLICAKYHSTSGWDSFIDTFANPSVFFELPPNCTEERKQLYDMIAQQLIAEGRGTIESGTKIQTVETHQQYGDVFEARAKWCKEAIITLCTGSTLTMTTAPDSGTLAGNAHEDSKDALVTATARRISRAVQTQFVRPLLQEAFPHEPLLVRFTLEPEEEEDRAAQAQVLATLAGAGYRVSDEEASEMMGMELTYHEPAAAMPSTGMPLANRAPAPPAAEPPLTEGELAALGQMLKPDTLTQGADALAGMMAGRVIANSEEDKSNCKARNKERCPYHHPGAKEDTGEKEEDATEDRNDKPEGNPKDWKPITMPDMMTPEDAMNELKRGLRITNPLGEEVALDSRMVEHWKKAGKTDEDINRRLALLPLAKETIAHPAEIWESNENGSRTYLASVINPYENGKKYIVAFTQSRDNSVLETYFMNEHVTTNKRQGKQLWPKEQPVVSGT